MVVEFPCCYPEGSKLAKDMSAIEQLEVVKHLQNVYLDQRKMIDIPFEIKLHIKDINE